MANSKQLETRTVLITGAAGKLDGVAARACAEQGATVILLDKNVSGMEKVYDRIVSMQAPQPGIYPFDLAGATEQRYHELSEIIHEKYSVLDGLLHNAAVLDALSPVETLETTNWSNTLNINLNAPYVLTRVLLPLLTKADDASIVFTSDTSACATRAYWGAYGVSKIALEGFAKILADEFEGSGNLRVNTLLPGPVKSPLRFKAFPGEDSADLNDPESLADIYVYLLGPASRGTTGQTIQSNHLQ